MSSTRVKVDAILEEWQSGERNRTEISRRLRSKGIECAESTARRIVRELIDDGSIEEKIESLFDCSGPIFPDKPTPEQVGYDQDLEERIQILEEENTRLKSQMEWTTHSAEHDLSGGTATLNISDLHFHDKGHMLSCFNALTIKTLEPIRHFAPRKFVGIVNGDIIPGRGIYRNQAMETILPKTDQQIGAGAFKFFEFDKSFEKLLGNTPREWIFLKGNHDYSMGEPLTLKFVTALRMLDVNARYVGDVWIQNIADSGIHNVLFEHGYGASSYGPTSNKMVLETFVKIVDFQKRGIMIERVSHGHGHWQVVGIRRGTIYWDTTGGLQRNDRSSIGSNTRPTGWILYISTKGSSEILNPIEIIPPEESLRADLDDPFLEERNRKDASRCLESFGELMREKNIIADIKPYSSNNGSDDNETR